MTICTDSSFTTKLESQDDNGDTSSRVSEPLHEYIKLDQDNSGLFQSGAENLRLDEHIALNSGSWVPSSVAVEDNNANDLSGNVADINSQSLHYDSDRTLKHQLGTTASAAVRREFSVNSDGQTDHMEGNSESVSEGTVPSTMKATNEQITLSTETLQMSDIQAEESDLKRTLAEESITKDIGEDTFEIKSQSLPDGVNNLIKQQRSALAVVPPDASVDSSSQTDSVDGHWGSVSDGTFPSTRDVNEERAIIGPETLDMVINGKDDQRANLETTIGASEILHSDHSDIFDAPSFMTLVEPGNRGIDQQTASSEIQTVQNSQQPNSSPLRAGWFPSLTHDVKESPGRKKNEEIIAKVSNWSAGKPHMPLKNLLVEANLESKPKPPNPLEHPPTVATPKHEASAQDNNLPAKAFPSVTAPEASTAFAAKGDEEKEWNSPARLPVNKKEKRRARGNWVVPFVCCTSVKLDS
ncbi:uncharacterized protein LOC122657601 [Telopea speciosissima]|uniref:uncharacterized protein LOC122657601 n=1 Tax=Telopea speciosissima TaxID=54955 RepID=UPI001CC6C461|nr:uncharacterized protein LOC122657601 [Telopea speciosissima]